MKCPSCGSPRVYPSRLRNSLERLRQMLTDRQPHRCHGCGWRKWADVQIHGDGADVRPDDLRTGRVPKPVTAKELEQLDTSLGAK